MANTQRERQALAHYAAYKRSYMTTLYFAYKTPSGAKIRAWERCKEMMKYMDGHDLRVITHNGWMFTAGFMYTDKYGDDCFMYISPSFHCGVVV